MIVLDECKIQIFPTYIFFMCLRCKIDEKNECQVVVESVDYSSILAE
jgi:hypothetical protein